MASNLSYYRHLIALYTNLRRWNDVARVKMELNKMIATHVWGD